MFTQKIFIFVFKVEMTLIHFIKHSLMTVTSEQEPSVPKGIPCQDVLKYKYK